MVDCLVVSTALRPQSKTRVLASAMEAQALAAGLTAALVDLAEHDLPLCDGFACYQNPSVQAMTERVRTARSVVLCAPIYNYHFNAAAKNFVELTNEGWPDKPVGFVTNAGADRSFLSVLPLANSLWIDHHCLIAPRFVFATKTHFGEKGEVAGGSEIEGRMRALALDLKRLIAAASL